MNIDDAEQLGVVDGQEIELSSAQGNVVGLVALDNTLRRGVCALAHGFPGGAQSRSEAFCGTSVAVLIDDSKDYDAHSGLPRMSAIPVEVRLL